MNKRSNLFTLSMIFILLISGCIGDAEKNNEPSTEPTTNSKTAQSGSIDVEIESPSKMSDEESFTVSIESENEVSNAVISFSNFGPYISSRCKGENEISLEDKIELNCDLKFKEKISEDTTQNIFWEISYSRDAEIQIDELELFSQELFEREEPKQKEVSKKITGPLNAELSFSNVPGVEGEKIQGILSFESNNKDSEGVSTQEYLDTKFEIGKIILSFPRGFDIQGITSFSLTSECDTTRVCYSKENIKLNENGEYSEDFTMEIENLPSGISKETFMVKLALKDVKYYQSGDFEIDLVAN